MDREIIRTISLLVGLCLAAIGPCGPALADSDEQTQQLSEVVVTGEHPVSASSQAFIPDKDFELRPQGRPSDLLRLAPGLFIAQHQGGGKAEQTFLRGFDNDHGTDIAEFVDDVPVNLRSHAHGQGYADLHFLIPETVKEVQVSSLGMRSIGAIARRHATSGRIRSGYRHPLHSR